MSAVTLWVRMHENDGEWWHGTTSDDVLAVELVGTAVLTAGADRALITMEGEDPSAVDTVIGEAGIWAGASS